jgi:hypothetical protein
MMAHWRPFLVGALFMLLIVGAYSFFTGSRVENESRNQTINTPAPSDAVTIIPLPSFRIITGNQVPFEGKVELRQAIAGHFAKNLVVVNFQASGEHAEKSMIKIVWENGEIEKIYPGTRERIFLPDKRAAEIIIVGYSMNERKIFRDTPHKGILNWEIRYEPVEI